MKRLFLLLILLVIIGGCKQVDYTAPTGAVLTITANPLIVTLNGGTSEITVMGQRKSGAPLTDGTVIYFSVDIGTVVPNKIETKGGFARIAFISDSRSGEATVSAYSGSADKVDVKLTVGAKAFGAIQLEAAPPVLPRGGGTSAIKARVTDTETSPMPNIPVYFTTDSGSLKSNGQPQYTDSNGVAKDVLTTSITAKVTGAVGDKTGDVTINVGDCTGDGCNKPPVPSFVYSPTPAVMNQTTHFDASTSYDPDGSINKYEWDFGDGISGNGIKPTHVYTTSTGYNVILKVTDNLGLWATTSQLIQVNTANCSLQVGWGANDSTGDNDGILEVNEKIQFVATTDVNAPPCNSTPPSTNPCCIVTYNWTWGDGQSTPSSQPATVHQYLATGPYTVTLTIQNRQLSTSTPSQGTIYIYNQNIVIEKKK